MAIQHNALPNVEGKELDAITEATIERATFVKFAPPDFYEMGQPKDAGEFHIALLSHEPGDTLTFDLTADSQNPSFMNLGRGGLGSVWVVTESGNRYGIGNGFVYNHNAKGAFMLDPDATQLQLRVGQGAHIPGVGDISDVKSMLFSDQINYGGEADSWTGRDPSGARIVNAVDPLMDVREIGTAVGNGSDPSYALIGLQDDVTRSHAVFV